jgi:hypothetical protein
VALNAVQKFVRDQLQGLKSQYLPGLVVVIEPPPTGAVAPEPRCYIWAAEGHQERQTMPRTQPGGTGGYVEWLWRVDLGVVCTMAIGDPNIDAAFPLLIDQIVAALNLIPLAQFITDPDTQVQSQLLSIAEVVDVAYARVRTTGATGGATTKFAASLTVQVKEAISYNAPSYYNAVGQSSTDELDDFLRDTAESPDPLNRRFVPVTLEELKDEVAAEPESEPAEVPA